MPDYNYQADTRAFSQVLDDIGAKDDPKLYLGELINAFGERGFGALMVFLGLLNALASPIPGSTTILGTPLLLVSLQLVIRQDQLWLPRFALKQAFPREEFRRVVARIRPHLHRVERLSRPRLGFMSSEISEVLIGIACSVLAVIVMLPIFGGNMFPSLFCALFGFGLMQRDGVMIALGWIGCAGFAAFVYLAWNVIVGVFQATLSWWASVV